jgi:hypothetical protein
MVCLGMILRFGYASHLVMLAKDRSLAAKSRPLLARWQTTLSGQLPCITEAATMNRADVTIATRGAVHQAAVRLSQRRVGVVGPQD